MKPRSSTVRNTRPAFWPASPFRRSGCGPSPASPKPRCARRPLLVGRESVTAGRHGADTVDAPSW